MNDPRRFAPATARNREPILDVLRGVVSPNANVLEIASGSGEHGVFLAPALAVSGWQPSDPDPEARASIDAWRISTGDARILPALELDVARRPWPALTAPPDVIVCVNMIHIAPWDACEGLMELAGERLLAGGLLYLYGPYRRDGRHTAPSNEAFDQSLRTRDPSWGIRDLEKVSAAAAAHQLSLHDVIAMPANNLSVLFRR